MRLSLPPQSGVSSDSRLHVRLASDHSVDHRPPLPGLLLGGGHPLGGAAALVLVEREQGPEADRDALPHPRAEANNGEAPVQRPGLPVRWLLVLDDVVDTVRGAVDSEAVPARVGAEAAVPMQSHEEALLAAIDALGEEAVPHHLLVVAERREAAEATAAAAVPRGRAVRAPCPTRRGAHDAERVRGRGAL